MLSKIWFSKFGQICVQFDGCPDTCLVEMSNPLSDRDWLAKIGFNAEAFDAIGSWLLSQ